VRLQCVVTDFLSQLLAYGPLIVDGRVTSAVSLEYGRSDESVDGSAWRLAELCGKRTVQG
jgi:hypothetical protein